jgi:TrmH family RNA methyltransferase
MKIISAQNPRIKQLVRLRERREREQTGLFLIEGYRELSRAIHAGYPLEALFFCPSLFLGENEKALLARSGTECVECSEDVFVKISYRDRPDGLLAVAPQRKQGLQELGKQLAGVHKPLVLVAESIEKPGNLGTILRSCDAAGVNAVIVCDPTTDVFNPNVVRSSVGTLFTVPVFEAGSEETIRFLKERRIYIAAATPQATVEFTRADFTVPLAVAVGTEQYGLSQQWMECADVKVKIPMFGVADSLNVAAATTLVLYEAVRQRHP